MLAIPAVLAEKVAGLIDKFNAIDPIFADVVNDVEWFVLPVTEQLRNLPKKYKDKIKAKIQDGTIKVFDTEVDSPITRKWNAIKNETEEESAERIARRATKWDYMAKDITIE